MATSYSGGEKARMKRAEALFSVAGVVAFVICGTGLQPVQELPFSEKSAAATGLRMDLGHELIAYFLRGATSSKATTVTFGLSFVAIDNSAEDIIGEFIRQRINSPA